MNREDLIQEVVELMARCQRPVNFSAWQKLGISHSQVGLLFMLSYHKRLQAKQIAEYLGISKSAVSQLADPLIKKGLLGRQIDPKDRRIAHLTLTTAGQKEIKKLHKLKYSGLRSRLDNLSTTELKQLANLARKIAAAPLNK